MRRAATFSVLTSLIISSSPAVALAQGDGLPGDPPPGSPSGTIYEIPLDSARGDAAPRGGPGDGADGQADSPIRSENNFGSSSSVPGVGFSAGGADTGGGKAAAGAAGPSAPTMAGLAATAAETDGSGPSATLAIALLALVVLVGVGAGTAAARAGRA